MRQCCSWHVLQAQQEHLNERRRLEDQLSNLQHRLASEHGRNVSAIDTLRQQHASDQGNLSDQLAAAQQQGRVEIARLTGRLESAIAEVRQLRPPGAPHRPTWAPQQHSSDMKHLYC